MSEAERARAEAAEKTVEVLKRKVIDLYNGGQSAIQRQLEATKRREEANRRKRELAEVRATELVKYSQTLEAEVARRTEAIKTILDNVTFGFLIVERNLTILPESTRSCARLFETEQIEGQRLCDLLAMSPRVREEFLLAADQVFEDILPSEVSLGQLRQKFPRPSGRILRAEGSVIRGPSGDVRALLFTISDITDLEDATREITVNRTLISILKQKDAFQSFLAETKEQLAAAEAGDQALARRVVHTIKGNAASYGLTSIVDVCHEIEEHGHVSHADLGAIASSLRGFLEDHRGVLEIDFDRIREQPLEITAEQMSNLRRIIAETNGSASAKLRGWTAHVLRKPAAHMIGPIEDFTAKLAERLGKDVELELAGADATVDSETMRPVLLSLSHLVRNAVDHGIEPPDRRGSKPARGKVRIELATTSDAYVVMVEDDGRGIDLATLRKRAIELALAKPEHIERMGNGGLDLVFVDGLSTAAVTTNISGRGMGMSAVRAAVEAAQGRVAISSSEGRGTSFTLTIPKREIERASEVQS